MGKLAVSTPAGAREQFANATKTLWPWPSRRLTRTIRQTAYLADQMASIGRQIALHRHQRPAAALQLRNAVAIQAFDFHTTQQVWSVAPTEEPSRLACAKISWIISPCKYECKKHRRGIFKAEYI